MDLFVDYGTHQTQETWDYTDQYCPVCGKKYVWVGDGYDYYEGLPYLCVSCGSHWNTQGISADMGNAVKQRIISITKGI